MTKDEQYDTIYQLLIDMHCCACDDSECNFYELLDKNTRVLVEVIYDN